MTRILFLDLDGTVRYSNQESGFINKPEDIEVYPEAREQIIKAMASGWRVFYVSNQGGIAAGFTTEKDFVAGVYRTNVLLGLEESAIYAAFCCHEVNAGCICRKPLGGMVAALILDLPKQIGPDGKEEPVDVRQCLFVGDRPEDEGCAKACGIPFKWAEEWRWQARTQ